MVKQATICYLKESETLEPGMHLPCRNCRHERISQSGRISSNLAVFLGGLVEPLLDDLEQLNYMKEQVDDTMMTRGCS